MNESELYGRVIRVQISKEQQKTGAWSGNSSDMTDEQQQGIVTYSEPQARKKRDEVKVQN